MDVNQIRRAYCAGWSACDDDHQVAEAYGVWGEKKMYGKTYMGVVRSAFLIDEAGKIAATGYNISPKNTVPELKRWLG